MRLLVSSHRSSKTAFGVALLLFAAVFASTPAFAKRVCTQPERDAANAELMRYDAHDPAGTLLRAASLGIHLPWGVPGPTADTAAERTLYQRDFVARYHTGLRVPLWSAERIDADRLRGGRIDCFRPDPRLDPADASTPADYDEPIYDQGHLTPNGDQTASDNSIINSFVQSNMTPQTCQFNQGIWQILEGITRRWATARHTLYLVNGSVFDRDNDGARDPDSSALRMRSRTGSMRVAVPSAFYKIAAYRRPDGRLQSLSIMMPNDNTRLSGPQARAYLQSHVTTIATIERVTGLDFFPNESNIMESATFWAFTGNLPANLCRR